MKKKLLYIFAIAAMTLGVSSCGEDDLVADNSISDTIYDAEGGAEGSLGAQIDAFYNKYGSKILYNFNTSDLAFGWSSKREYWYAPADTTGDYVSRMIKKLDEELLTDYPADFTKKFMPYRIFLVDSICNTTSYSKSALVDILELRTHGIAISHCGKDMDDMSDSDWDEMKKSVNSFILSSVLSTAGVEPTEFLSLYDGVSFFDGQEDPQGEFSLAEYSLLSIGLVGGTIYDGSFMTHEYLCGVSTDAIDEIMIGMRDGDSGDLGTYINFIMNNTKTYLDKVFNRFPLVKKRAALVYTYMLDNTDTDLIKYQNEFCASDPLPTGYFAQ